MTQRKMSLQYNETGAFIANSVDGEVCVVGMVVTMGSTAFVAWTLTTAGVDGCIQKDGLEKLDEVLVGCYGCEPLTHRVNELAKGWDALSG